MLWDYNRNSHQNFAFFLLSDVFTYVCHMELPYRGNWPHIQKILGVILFQETDFSYFNRRMWVFQPFKLSQYSTSGLIYATNQHIKCWYLSGFLSTLHTKVMGRCEAKEVLQMLPAPATVGIHIFLTQEFSKILILHRYPYC